VEKEIPFHNLMADRWKLPASTCLPHKIHPTHFYEDLIQNQGFLKRPGGDLRNFSSYIVERKYI
jgi:hypothetical protein